MSLLTKTLGRIAPGYQSFSSWCQVYDKIIGARPLGTKTLQNRRKNVAHLVLALGDKSMRSIRPVHVSVAVRDIWQSGTQFTARRVLIEAVDIFNEAILAGVIDTNPAIHIKQMPARIKRQRLTLEQWQAMYWRSVDHNVVWLPKLLLLALATGQRRADLQKLRFDDVWDDHLHVIQQKTGTRLALPLTLRLDAIEWTLGDVIKSCRNYAPTGKTLLRKPNGKPPGLASLSARFEECFDSVYPEWPEDGTQPSLHECRSLAERLYRAQGIDTQTLLGHKHQSMTDKYNDDRGLSRNDWKTLVL
ncbi:MAG: tyrosine-type recombinase/integrase [Gammaproteobacteria bacterium]|nr:tyrosine-type recombinase/integrase [Gammaproteobacteria bacterium]